MKKVHLFIAMSLDGYIADREGKIDWLQGDGTEAETIDSYSEFIKGIDTILMGWNTYHQIVTELSPEQWVYEECVTYVMTHREQVSSEKIRFVNSDLIALVKELKKEDGKDIWICGGADLVQQLVNEDLIDCYYVTVVPTILGDGIRLFENLKQEIKLKLVKTKSYNGMNDLIYTRAERYEFRTIRLEETDQATKIEQICFSPNEACSYEHMAARIKKAPELFWVAVDKDTGKLAGFLNGLATNQEHLTDDFFTDAQKHEPEGSNIMLLGLDVLPEYRGQGLARKLVEEYLEKERKKNRKKIILTCVEEKVKMYEKFGFQDLGIGVSNWGGEQWHEMCISVN